MADLQNLFGKVLLLCCIQYDFYVFGLGPRENSACKLFMQVVVDCEYFCT